MKKFYLYTNENVTPTLLAFGQDIEIFQHAKSAKDEQLSEPKTLLKDGYFTQTILSKGKSEQTNPLPIVTALSKRLLEKLRSDPSVLSPENHEADQVMVTIVKDAFKSLGVDYATAFIGIEHYGLLDGRVTINKVKVSLIYELLCLIQYVWERTPATPTINFEFQALKQQYDWFYEREFGSLALADEIRSKRIKQVTLIDGDVIKEFKSPKDLTKPKSAIQTGASTNPLSFAWLEVRFSEVLSAKFGICTFCGQTYALEGLKGRGGKKSTCGEAMCQKILRKQNDKWNRESNPEKIRKNERIRKHKSIAYKEIIIEKKTTVQEFAEKWGYKTELVEQWIAKRKRKNMRLR
ncbi:hypothetical protein [Peribacillus sp. SCS-155]|uniref:hypothetical protein n=1 Tax=Peribacillus sedimenti TaxID=3115297 RepID=UPI003906B4DC